MEDTCIPCIIARNCRKNCSLEEICCQKSSHLKLYTLISNSLCVKQGQSEQSVCESNTQNICVCFINHHNILATSWNRKRTEHPNEPSQHHWSQGLIFEIRFSKWNVCRNPSGMVKWVLFFWVSDPHLVDVNRFSSNNSKDARHDVC